MSSSQNKLNFTKTVLNSVELPAPGKRSLYYDSKTPGLGIRITNTGDKSFIVYRKINGKPERITLGRYPELQPFMLDWI